MKLNDTLTFIDQGTIALPVFQRGYVWNGDQVRSLMKSLYRGYPVGSLLVWETPIKRELIRGEGIVATGSVKLLLDGQQRITSLYGIIRGTPPPFFEGDASAFKNLYFHLQDEDFQFYTPMKVKGDPLWIDVTQLMQRNIAPFLNPLNGHPNQNTYINRMLMLYNIRERDFYVETVTGEKTIDDVVEIFTEVNKRGTKLSKGDLALARVCASWPEARDTMNVILTKWRKAGFDFQLDWLMRCINTTLTGEAYFEALKDINTLGFQQGLLQTEKHINRLLDLIASRLGLDHDRVLGSRYSFTVAVRYLEQRKGRWKDQKERDQFLYWYIHTFLWGRYTGGQVESRVARDLSQIAEKEGALDRLINELHQIRRDLSIAARDFEGWSMSARFYPLLYMLTRVWGVQDWESGIELTAHLRGKTSGLQIHHIFPKARLYEAGYDRTEVNQLANFTFLTQETNLIVTDRNPSEYLEEYATRNPGVIESHWIPMDRSLWHVEKYREFLEARRELLAKAANEFLDSLLAGSIPEPITDISVLEREVTLVPGHIEDDVEQQTINECNGWVIQQGMTAGEASFELVDTTTGAQVAILDLAWPNGLQVGKTDPVAILIDEGIEILNIAQSKGFVCFTDIERFKDYVLEKIVGLHTVTS